MEFNLLNSREYAATIHNGQAELYKAVGKTAFKSEWIRLSAPLVAIASSILKLTQRVVSVAETIIKGLANLFAFPFTKKCEFGAALNQLFVKLPMDLIALALSPIEVTVGSVITTGGILFNPKKYCEDRFKLHAGTAEAFNEAKDARNIQLYSMMSTFLFS